MKVRYTFIEQKAEEVRMEAGSSVPTPIEALIQRHGIFLDKNADLEEGVSGFSLSEHGKKAISVRASDSPLRKRFTIAHELAHLLLHEDRNLNINKGGVIHFRNQKSRTGEDWREIEANHFAACLLMPRKEVISALHALIHGDAITESTIESLADKFGVSVQAMSVRLAALGLS